MKSHSIASKTVIAALACVGLIGASGCSEGIVDTSDDGNVTLQFASFLPKGHPYSVWYLDWADEVTEATDGRVTFDNYFSGSLYNGPDMTSAVIDGQVDLAQPNTNYTPEKFPLSELVSVPYATPSVGAAMEALTDLYANYEPYTEEFDKNGVIPLQFQPTGTNVLGSSIPLPDADAIDGARVRSASYFAKALQNLGGNAISMPLSDVYQSMQTGLIDAWMTPMENTDQYNLGEVTTHIQDPGMGPTSLSALLMNKDTFESLTNADQKAVLDISAKYNEGFIDLLNEIDEDTCESMADSDIVLDAWDDSTIEKTKDLLADSMLDAYAKDAKAAGAEPEGFIEKWQSYQSDHDGSRGEYVGSVATCLAAK